MKKIRQFIVTSLVFALALPLAASAVGSPPTIPLLVYGDVSLYGVTVPEGTIISVLKNGTVLATTTVNAAGKYFFQIPASNAGSLLTYKIGSLTVVEKVCLDPLQYASDRINLIVVAPSAPSGGGGGSYAPPSPLSAAAQKVDANKDGKIDVLDFNSLMINWGNTSSGNIADFNGDGKVDIFDFNMLMINWTA